MKGSRKWWVCRCGVNGFLSNGRSFKKVCEEDLHIPFRAPTAAHFFCNATGVPDVAAAARSRHRNVVLVAYAVGILAFGALLWPLTDPEKHPGSRWDDLVAVSARRPTAR